MEKKLKVLLSAYACEPNTGSEPEIGWGWAKGLYKKGYDVSVITRESNRKKIEATMLQNPEIKIDFYYYDLNKIILKLIKGRSNSYSYFYFILWQFRIYSLAKAIIKKKKIDVIHHVTFGSLRYPSFLGLLKIPLIFGPVGGGEKTPKYLKKSFNYSNKLKEFIRELSTSYVKLSPLMNLTFYFSNKIYRANKWMRKKIPTCSN